MNTIEKMARAFVKCSPAGEWKSISDESRLAVTSGMVDAVATLRNEFADPVVRAAIQSVLEEDTISVDNGG